MSSDEGVIVVSHRGLSGHGSREHTVTAYRRAIADGADGIECDLRLTRDRILVCVHDRLVGEPPGGRRRVSRLRLADLARPERDPGGDGTADEAVVIADRGGPLAFEQLLEVVRACKRPVQLHVETKHPTHHGGRVEDALVRTLARYGLLHHRAASPPVWVMSFSTSALCRIQARAPGLPTVLLLDRAQYLLRGHRLPRGVPAIGPSLEVLRADPGYVRWLHAQGRRVHTWTVNGRADIEWVLDLGVDTVITDRPRRVRAVLERTGAGPRRLVPPGAGYVTAPEGTPNGTLNGEVAGTVRTHGVASRVYETVVTREADGRATSLAGLARTTDLSEDEVRHALRSLGDDRVLRAGAPEEGRPR